jgi:DNA-binding PadR family transcriptional regulator
MLLAILAKGESYGYAMIEQVRVRSGGDLEWSEGMLYPVLHRLEKERLVLSSWKLGENGRKRKYYRLSAAGTKALEVERRQWNTVHDTLSAIWGVKACLT